jgi:hypothetical protein
MYLARPGVIRRRWLPGLLRTVRDSGASA